MNVSIEIRRSFFTSLWFMFLTFPLMVVRVNTIENVVEWRWWNLAIVGAGSFVLSFVWRALMRRKARSAGAADAGAKPLFQRFVERKKIFWPSMALALAFVLLYPQMFAMYQTNIVTNALIYVMLGLGLNIVVGLAGLLDLGYVAFYAVGAYSYALINQQIAWYGFWVALPVGALLGALFGVLLGFPVLRLRGDYLAIVTLGFGEIIRLVLENWNEFSHGPSGVANIPPPGFFGMNLDMGQKVAYVYYLMVGLTVLTIIGVRRLKDSRIGRAWMALREDEIACQAMGIDKTRTKLTAFALGATWASMAGVVFAAKTGFINPISFTFMESAIILSIVVLGGQGSIPGVIMGALVLTLLPEYLRDFEKYRLLIFGACMVLMMDFRPQGLITAIPKRYVYKGKAQASEPESAREGS